MRRAAVESAGGGMQGQGGHLRPHLQGAPIVKWVGGKSRLLPELVARMPAQFGRYYEPFAGSAALFFRVAPARAVLGDANRALMNVYQVAAFRVDDLINRLTEHRRLHDKTHYYEMRARWNDACWNRKDGALEKIERAAAFIYLNKTCFNGLWRVNRAGHFNVSMGRYEDPPICAAESLRVAAIALRSAELRCGHYRETVSDARAGDFVYFDPPYDTLTPTSSFTSYTSEAFGQDDQRELAELARRLVARGCKVMLSNSDTPFVRSTYKGFRIDRVRCGRAINSNAAKRGKVQELIIRGFQ